MKNFRFLTATIICSVCWLKTAQGYVVIEPRLGMENGNFKYSSMTNVSVTPLIDDGTGTGTLVPGTPTTSNTQIDYAGKSSGTTVGLKAGYVFDQGLYLGFEGQALIGGKIKVGTDSAGKTVEDYNATRPLMSLLVGYYFPQWFQVTYGYIFINDLSVSNNSISAFKFKGGSGHMINLGFALASYLNLNLEYLLQTHKQYATDSTSGSLGLPTDQLGTFYGNVTSNSLNFYLSFPIPFAI